MTTFFAQPYDLSARGFYFDTAEQFKARMASVRNDFGDPVEEFEIQFIDGDDLDCSLADAFGINQANICRCLDMIEEWDEDQKTRFIIAVGECGYSCDCDPDNLDIDIYEISSLKQLAEQFVDEGLFGDIPDSIQTYLDYDLIARDLSADYSEIDMAGKHYVYRCG